MMALQTRIFRSKKLIEYEASPNLKEAIEAAIGVIPDRRFFDWTSFYLYSHSFDFLL